MKLLHKCATLTVIMSVCSVALADDEMMMKHADEMMSMCDTNKDGKISKEEFTTEKMKKFSMYDKDSDGTLSKAEHQMMAMDMHKMMMGEKGRGMMSK